MTKKIKRNKKRVLTPDQKKDKEKKDYIKLVQHILLSMGFKRIKDVSDKNFFYKERQTELDDIFILENLIIFTEYTSRKDPEAHLKNKNFIYDRIIKNKRDFLTFLTTENTFPELSELVKSIDCKFQVTQFQLSILYCSRYKVEDEYKKIMVDGIKYFDFPVVKYFESLVNVIKKTAIFDFLDFLSIESKQFGDNIFKAASYSSSSYEAQILPEDRSLFSRGQKIISFYIDAQSLLKRAYVLRRDGWKNCENIGHYQRMLVTKKINSMRKYLSEKERVFVNNIITTISTKDISLLDKDDNEIKLKPNGEYEEGNQNNLPVKVQIPDKPNIIGIIDGQHRTYSYYEGSDIYEPKIAKFRRAHNLLITTILSPITWNDDQRIKFEADLFMEINSNQTSAEGLLKQEIELIIHPYSPIAIAKRVLNILKSDGPLSGLLENYWYDYNSIKTTTIVSYGLKPLTRLDSSDSIFTVWDHPEKNKIEGTKDTETSALLDLYIKFAAKTINNILSGYEINLSTKEYTLWRLSKNFPDGILSVSSVIGMFNSLRLLIRNEKHVYNFDKYKEIFKDVYDFKFKDYKSSQYMKMGEALHKRFFTNQTPSNDDANKVLDNPTILT